MIEMELEDFLDDPTLHLEEAAKKGEVITLLEFGEPVAEVRPLPALLTPKAPPPIGLAEGQGVIHPNAFDPLPDDLLDAFEGKSE